MIGVKLARKIRTGGNINPGNARKAEIQIRVFPIKAYPGCKASDTNTRLNNKQGDASHHRI